LADPNFAGATAIADALQKQQQQQQQYEHQVIRFVNFIVFNEPFSGPASSSLAVAAPVSLQKV